MATSPVVPSIFTAPAGVGGTGEVHINLVKGPLKILGPGQSQPTAGIKGASIEIIDTLTHKALVTGKTDAKGAVVLTVPAGSYKIHVVTCPGADGLPPLIPTVVRAGGASGVMIGCSTKARAMH